MTIPAWVVSDDGRTTVTFRSQPHQRTREWYTVRILPEDVAILFRVGSFGWNFLRGTVLLMAQLAYLAAVNRRASMLEGRKRSAKRPAASRAKKPKRPSGKARRKKR